MAVHKYLQIVIIFIIGSAGSMVASDSNPGQVEFDHITIGEGLPNNRVDCMLQDYQGYIWLGTKRGLCRYNGYDFKNYTSIINDTTSLRYHQISALLETSDSTLWIGTWEGGLHQYNRKKDNFIRINTGFNNNILKLFADSRGSVWIATAGQLLIMENGKDGRLKEITQPDGISSLPGVSAFYEDKDGRIFIASGNLDSLCIYNYKTQSTTLLGLHSYKGLLPRNVNYFFDFDQTNVWLAADNGLFNYNRETGFVGQIDQEESPEQGAQIKFVLQANDGNIWLGGEGLYVYQRITGQFSKFVHHMGNPQTILGNLFTFGFQDNQNNLWFCTFSQGINIVYHKTKIFNKDYELAEKLINASNNITAIHKSEEGYLFLGTWDKGLLILNENNEFVRSKKGFSELKHLEKGVVRSIFEDRNGILWIGSENNLLTRFDLKNKKAATNRIDENITSAELQITSVLTDSEDRVWVANSTGVFQFEPATGFFKEILANANTQNLSEDSYGNIWCANYNNDLCLINKKDLSVSCFKSNGRNSNLPDEKFVCTFKDSKGRMWVGTEFNGLFVYHAEKDSFQQFTIKDGLPSNDICSIEEDSKGRLWIGTNHGLSRFNYNLKDFSNYFRSDGMTADEFHYNASFRSHDGILFFGCTSGIVFFDPDDIRSSYQSLPVRIEDVRINYGTVTRDLDNQTIQEAVGNGTSFKLRYNQNTINIKYTTLNYSKSKKSKFAYQLLGLDGAFNYVNNQREITYTNLKPGKYTFRVIASNNDNIWDREGAEITFEIKSPPWLTWWAYILYSFVFALVIYSIRHQVRQKERMKAAIQLERLEKNQQKELTQMKLSFFTNISHEFKTPLTLIIGPLEQIISDMHGKSILKNKLKQINANSKRLLDLINLLIDFRRIEQDVMPLSKTSNNLNDTVQKIMDAFRPLALKNEINFLLETETAPLYFNYDQEKVEAILYNVLSNAFKFTPGGGSVTVRFGLKNADTVYVRLADTGCGITPEKIKSIFERFNNSSQGDNFLEMKSSGIGLAYSKKLAELHGGSLVLESERGKGTIVTLELPYDRQPLPLTLNAGLSKTTLTDTPDWDGSLMDTKHDVKEGIGFQILVVEDDEELRKFIVSILGELYHVDEAEDGETGYKLVLENDYDLIISDVMMPKMSGTQLCQKIKSNIKTSHLFVILLTAKSDTISITEGYETGADSYIVKPFYPQNLILVIKNLLSTRQHIRSFYTSLEDNNQEPPGIHPRDRQFIADVIALIDKNIDEENFSVEILGKELGLSRTHLFRKFKSLTGTAPHDFIRQVRLKKAARLIREGNYSISEIGYMVGFKTPANFSTSFRHYYGKSPKEYQAKNKE